MQVIKKYPSKLQQRHQIFQDQNNIVQISKNSEAPILTKNLKVPYPIVPNWFCRHDPNMTPSGYYLLRNMNLMIKSDKQSTQNSR